MKTTTNPNTPISQYTNIERRFLLPMPNDRECEKRYFRVDRRQIHFLKFILEGYDGVAVLRTIDPHLGLVVLSVAPGCGLEVDRIIRDLGKDMRIEAAEAVREERR